MKKTTKICFGIFVAITILMTTAFNLKKSPLTIIDKFGNANTCSPNINKSSSGSKVAYTQSAHDQTSPGTCSGCHSGGTATPVATITASPAFGTGNTYVPGTTYTISYQVSGYTKYGFDLEMNNGNTVTSMTAGTLSALTNTRYTAAPTGGYPANISQNATIPSTTAATFRWVAPAVGTTVYLFSNALGVNGNGSTSGDKEAFKNIILTPAVTGVLTISCPSAQTINSSVSTVVPNLTTTTTASTTCPGGAVTKTQSPVAGSPLTPGNNIITVTATDNCGNTQTCTSTINYVVNTGVLTITCPANQTITSSTSTVVPNLTTSSTASTTCPGGTVSKTQSPVAGSPLTPGNNIITVTATDNCGNTQTCTSTINYVVNTGVLTITCPANQTITSSTSTVVPNLTTSSTASTTCPGGTVSKTQSPVAGSSLTPGNNIITVTATDNCGNTQTCTSTINYVVNTGVLTITCPANQTITSSTSTVVPNLTTASTASTTCPGGTVTKTQSPAAGTSLTPGNNVITVTATDNCGNTQTCTSTINYVVNTGVLTITCPANQTISSSTSTVVPNLTTSSTASTTCPGGTVSKTQSPAAGSSLTPGNNIITVTATDNCGNTQTCTSTINYVINTGALIITCPANQTINSSNSTVVPNLTTSLNATTTCPGGTVTKTQSPAVGTPLTLGNNTITITATDNCGNTQTCTTIINYVSSLGTLNVTCPANQTINSSTQTYVPNLVPTSTSISSCTNTAVTVTQSPSFGSPLSAGNNTVTLTASDNCGNLQTCTSTINYVINTTVLTLNCSPSQTILSTSSTTVPNMTNASTATSTCSNNAVTITQSPAIGSPLTPGNNVITITATDNCGNTHTCVTTVNYIINTGVITLNCPQNQTINASQQTTLPDLTISANASSTCIGSAPVITQSPLPGTAMTQGPNTVTFTATDICNTVQTCQILVNYQNDLGVENNDSFNQLEVYPNPSRGELTINYSLKSESKVIVSVNDMNGKEIISLINENAAEGSYSRNVILDNLNKGIYCVNFNINGNLTRKKLIID